MFLMITGVDRIPKTHLIIRLSKQNFTGYKTY